MKKNIFKIFALLMILAMVVAPVSATPTAKGVGPDDLSPVDPSEVIARHPYPDGVDKAIKDGSGPARFIIQLEDAPLAVYDGSLDGLKATSPSVTGAAKLDVKSPESKAYLSYLSTKQTSTVKSMESVLGRSIKVAFQYQVGLNGFAVELSPEELEVVVRQVSGIVSVEREKIQQLDTDVGPAFIGAPAIWNDSTDATKGEDMLVGIIDSGINFDHPSFAEVGPVDGYVHENPLGADTFLGVCDPTNTDQYDASYECNNKLIGAYSYVTTDSYELYTPEDSGGHGSHTASTVAGNVVEATMEKPTLDETQTISGVAPHANIIAYDVCYEDSTDGGCGGAAINAAIEQAIIDGVDVINFSISGGADPYGESTEQLFLSATNAGIFVSTSAGNNGPDPETTGHRSPWLMSTAASTHNRTYVNGLVDMTGGDTAAPADIEGKGFASGVGPLPIVYAGDYGNALCLGAEDSGAFNPGTDFTGQIVVCDRGTSARVRKAEVVAALGAEGYVLANDETSADALVGDAYVIPGVHITYDDGVVLKTWMASGTGHTATVLGATRDTSASNGNIMADFSSRGPNGTIDVLKPDVTAPGVDIWAAVNSPVPGVGNPEYDFYSGTSMSSPHTAGAATLLMALHPDWTPMEVKSALMLTAVNPGILKEDASTLGDVFDFGAGLIQVDLATKAGLVMDESTADFLAANPADGGNPQELNLASVYNSLCLSECSWTRTVKNVLGVEGSWTVSTTATDAVITVTPATFTLAAGATQELTITANVDAAEIGVWTFGDIQLVEDSSLAPDSHIPLAVNPSSGVLPEKLTINTRRDAGSKLVEDLQAIEITDFTVEYFGLAEGAVSAFSLEEDPTNGAIYDDLSQVFYTTVVVGADAVRLVAEITDTLSQDMDLFVGLDTGDGIPQEEEEVCTSATGAVFEYCDIMDPEAGTYWVLAQNWTSSDVGVEDDIEMVVGVVTNDQNNMQVTGPDTVAKGDLFDIRFYWDDTNFEAGDYWYGVFSLGADAGNPGNIGQIPVDFHRLADDVTKTGATQAEPGDEVTFTITIQPNVSGEDLIYTISDVLPDGLELVPGSITGGASAVGNRIYWSGVMKGTSVYVLSTNADDAMCDTPFGGYVDLEGFGIPVDQPDVVGDTDVWEIPALGDPFYFFGDAYDSVGFTDDGFLIFDPANNYGGAPWTTQALPNPNAPNNVAAFLWQDMEIAYDEDTNQGVTIANLTTGLPDQIPLARLIEYDDIYLYGDPTSTFDLEAFVYYGVDDSPGAYEMIFAYDNLVGDMSVATIGLENAIANEAYTLLNAGDASTVISDGSVVCVDFSGPTTPYEITYRAVVTGEVGDTITNVVDHSVFAIGYQSDQASMDVDVIDYGELTTTLAGPYRAYDNAEFNVTIDNPITGGMYPHAQLQYRIKDIDLDHIVSFEYEEFAVADLGLEPKAPAMWVDVPMFQDGDDVVGYIGLENGYPVYPDYNETINLRIVIAAHGEYEFDFQLVDLDETIPVDYIAEVSQSAFFTGHIFMPLIFK